MSDSYVPRENELGTVGTSEKQWEAVYAKKLFLDGMDLDEWMAKQENVVSGTVSLTNSEAFPFNNSQTTVSLPQARETTNYIVLTEVTAFSGNVGEVAISDKLVNGFKIGYNGSASSATIKYTVVGGFDS